MGDRVVVIFAAAGQDFAAVYEQWGGGEIEETLAGFFAAEDADPRHDNRFDDPEYLAARFLVHVSDSLGMGVGIVPTDRREYTNVRVHCDYSGHPRLELLSPYGKDESTGGGS